ncbi:MAG: malto-oligosyltrehalose synthase, partial [Acidimicrobiales bacterium]
LRIDHVDGLAEPGAYLRRLDHASGGTWMVVEKILEGSESIPSDWPVAGTTGYECLNLMAGLFVDADGLEPLTRIYAELTGIAQDFDEIAHVAKHEIMAGSLATDLTRVSALFARVCAGHRRFRDYSRSELAQITEEMIACMPVYRTYVGTNEAPSRSDVVLMESVAAEARKRRGDLDIAPNTFLAQVLSGRSRYWRHGKAGQSGLVRTDRPALDSSKDDQEDLDRVESELRVRFSQVSVAIMAKAVEDTAFYRYHRLISANEVGGSPGHPVTSLQHFHDACLRMAGEHPATMVTTSTHDTKRGEDARARISLLSEIPDEWGEVVRRWMARNQGHRVGRWPDANAEYLMYQTIVGAWPIEADRLVAFMAKAAKEAKCHTSWTDPDLAYEEALEGFVRAVMGDEGFLAEVERFVAPLVSAGRITSLAQTALRLTVPGVPDTYQGSELWNHSLVDPDNRTAVDFDRRRVLIGEIGLMTPAQLLERCDDAIPKLALTAAALKLRRAHPEWLGPGASYEALRLGGAMARHGVALGRGGGVVAVVPRLVLGLERAGGWGDTVVELPPGDWLDVIGTGRRVLESEGLVAVPELLAEFPVALLARQDG